MFSVAVDSSEELGARTASALLGHPLVDRVGLIDRDPPASWRPRAIRTDTGDGFDVGVGVDVDGIRVFRREAPDDGTGWASAHGLARCLESRLEPPQRAAVTLPGKPLDGGERFAFPPPLDWLGGELGELDVYECPVEGELAGVIVDGTGDCSIGCVDNAVFLATVCLAAGVVVAGATGTSGPVYEHPTTFLEACELFGLVFAVSSQPG